MTARGSNSARQSCTSKEREYPLIYGENGVWHMGEMGIHTGSRAPRHRSGRVASAAACPRGDRAPERPDPRVRDIYYVIASLGCDIWEGGDK